MTTYASGVWYVFHPKRIIRVANIVLDLRASIDYTFGAMYACLLNVCAPSPDSKNSICLLGLFLRECCREFRTCDHPVQGSWCSCMQRYSKLITYPQALLAGELLWITAVTFIRASVVFLYIWIFSKRPFRLVCYGFLTINLLYFTGTVLACCLICRPLAYSWNHSIHGTCGDQKSLYLFIGVLNLLMDVVTVALPMPVLWGLQMRTGRKIALSVLFSMGTAYESLRIPILLCSERQPTMIPLIL